MTREEWHWWVEGFDYGITSPVYDQEQLVGIPREHRKDWIQGFAAAQIRRTFGLGSESLW